jgi:glycosyltransferase involved in cell wall biosynthesis
VSKVLVMSLSDLGTDPRVDRQIGFLRETHRVIAAGLGPPAYEDVEYLELGRAEADQEQPPTRPSLLPRAARAATALLRLHHIAYWGDPAHRRWRVLLSGLGSDLVLVNDAAALPLAFAAATDAPVVFDAHEYAPTEFETSRLWRLLARPRVRWICRRYLPRLAGMMAVSEGIANRYLRDFAVRSVVVTNAPRFEALTPSEVHDPIRLVHFGWPDPQRRLEETLAAMQLLNEHYRLDLLLAGSGPAGYLDQLCDRASGDPRIRFLDPVPMREITRFANAYDIGVFLLPPQHVNQEFTLPNKFFEYIQGRIVPAIGPSPEMARIVREWDCGIVAADYTPEAFAAAIAGTSRARLAELKQNVDRAARELCAERNRPIVLDVVARALGEATSSAGRPSFPSAGEARASR